MTPSLVTDYSQFPIVATLQQFDAELSLYTHAPVFTVEEGVSVMEGIPGRGTKNLFLTDKNAQRFFLFTVSEEKRVDLKALSAQLSLPRFSFGSKDKLRECLGVEAGSVTVLAMPFDMEQRVKLYIDEDILSAERFQCHPLRNDATVVFSSAGLLRFLEARSIPWEGVSVPERSNQGA